MILNCLIAHVLCARGRDLVQLCRPTALLKANSQTFFV